MNHNPTRSITPVPAHSQPGVKTGLTPARRTRPVVENTDYAAFTRRIIRAHARRIATGDIEGLTTLRTLEDELTRAVTHAVTGLRAFGYSWTEIGARLRITRQAAQQRFGATDTAGRTS